MPTAAGLYTRKVTIRSGTTSTSCDSLGGVLVGIYVPTGVASTTLTIQGAGEEDTVTTWYPAYDDQGNAIGATIAATRYVSMRRWLPFGMNQTRIVTGSSETQKTFLLVFQQVV